MSRPDQPADIPADVTATGSEPVQPLDPPMVPFAVAGIIAWAAAGLALLPFRGALADNGHENWLWICLAGFLLGFPGLATMIRHDANRRRRRAARASGQEP